MGKISGMGNSQTRKNEITADDIATLRRYIFGWEYGVINRSGWNFNATPDYDTDTITIDKGIMFAYGYFGILPKSITIPFIKPSATQYRIIYAEIDRSVVPNTFKIKVKNNQGSNKIKPTTFRQDYLTAVKTGVFQLPLWQVELNNEGIVDIEGLVDLRNELGILKDSIKQVKNTYKITKTISSLAIGTTQRITDNSEKLATTEFVHLAMIASLDGTLLKEISNDNVLLLIANSRNYYKANKGEAICCLFNFFDVGTTNQYVIPLLVSTNPDAVTFSTSGDVTITQTYKTSILYKGLVYYISSNLYAMDNSNNSSIITNPLNLPMLNEITKKTYDNSNDSLQEAATDLLTYYYKD